MSLLDLEFSLNKKTGKQQVQAVVKDSTGNSTMKVVGSEESFYKPSEEETKVLAMVRDHFRLGDVTMQTPRHEFNDLSVLRRTMVDEMGFNTYQPNNGQPLPGDEINAWRSNAVRPIIRAKVVSIAARATAQLLFPKVFAYDQQSDSQKDAAQVMRDLMEWAGDQSGYNKTQFYATLASLVAPAAIIHTEFAQSYRTVKKLAEDGSWKKELMLDDNYSGFQDTIVPVDQFYIQNFFENDVQKQGWIIWRRVEMYSKMESKYAHRYENFKYVKPGVQLIYNDANQSFYSVYDPNMRQEECEEILYWDKNADLFLVVVNGVMLTTADNPNPRNDKNYPFISFGYEIIGDGKCFYYKSLAFKMQHDSDILNTLYPMVVDGTYLNIFPPMTYQGEDIISSDVIYPGKATQLTSPNANLKAITLSTNMRDGMDMLTKVEQSIDQTSEAPLFPAGAKRETGYEISKREQEASTLLGLYLLMKGFSVVAFGKLRLGDILQYLTIGDVSDITDDVELVYKTFLRHEVRSGGQQHTRRIEFNKTLPTDPQTEKELLSLSYDNLILQGGPDSDVELYRVNPSLFRDLRYQVMITSDSLKPMTEDMEKAYRLEAYDRLIANPMADQEAALRDFLLGAYPHVVKNPDKYISQQKPGQMQPPAVGQGGTQPISATPPGTPPQASPFHQGGPTNQQMGAIKNMQAQGRNGPPQPVHPSGF